MCISKKYLFIFITILLLLQFSACSDSNNDTNVEQSSENSNEICGYVIDEPVDYANVMVGLEDGTIIGEATTNSNGFYRIPLNEYESDISENSDVLYLVTEKNNKMLRGRIYGYNKGSYINNDTYISQYTEAAIRIGELFNLNFENYYQSSFLKFYKQGVFKTKPEDKNYDLLLKIASEVKYNYYNHFSSNSTISDEEINNIFKESAVDAGFINYLYTQEDINDYIGSWNNGKYNVTNKNDIVFDPYRIQDLVNIQNTVTLQLYYNGTIDGKVYIQRKEPIIEMNGNDYYLVGITDYFISETISFRGNWELSEQQDVINVTNFEIQENGIWYSSYYTLISSIYFYDNQLFGDGEAYVNDIKLNLHYELSKNDSSDISTRSFNASLFYNYQIKNNDEKLSEEDIQQLVDILANCPFSHVDFGTEYELLTNVPFIKKLRTFHKAANFAENISLLKELVVNEYNYAQQFLKFVQLLSNCMPYGISNYVDGLSKIGIDLIDKTLRLEYGEINARLNPFTSLIVDIREKGSGLFSLFTQRSKNVKSVSFTVIELNGSEATYNLTNDENYYRGGTDKYVISYGDTPKVRLTSIMNITLINDEIIKMPFIVPSNPNYQKVSIVIPKCYSCD